MKRFTVLTTIFGVSALVIWAILLVLPGSQSSVSRKYDNTPIQVYDATGEMLKAIQAGNQEQAVPVTGEQAIAPVYDATGAMLDAISPKEAEANTAWSPVYDATGAMLEAITPDEAQASPAWAPVYDATGAMLDAINP